MASSRLGDQTGFLIKKRRGEGKGTGVDLLRFSSHTTGRCTSLRPSWQAYSRRRRGPGLFGLIRRAELHGRSDPGPSCVSAWSAVPSPALAGGGAGMARRAAGEKRPARDRAKGAPSPPKRGQITNDRTYNKLKVDVSTGTLLPAHWSSSAIRPFIKSSNRASDSMSAQLAHISSAVPTPPFQSTSTSSKT